MENWESHNFLDGIKYLHESKMINWNNLLFYYRISEELKNPHLMIVSSVPLEYPELTDYNILRENMK